MSAKPRLNRRAFLKRTGLMMGTLTLASSGLWWPRTTPAQGSNTGALKWKFYANASVLSRPAVGAEGTIYFGEAKGGVRTCSCAFW